MVSSGTYNFSLSNSDIVFESYDRIGIRGTALTGEHMISARNSMGLELATWSNKGVNLWAVDLQSLPLIQGVSTYVLPPETVLLLDAYIETYQLTNTVNIAPAFGTLINSAVVQVTQANHGLIAGQWLNFTTPVSVGGVIVSGYYQVLNVVNANNYNITVATVATATVTAGGAVPTFTTQITSTTITVTLANHGYTPGQQFTAISTSVGGFTVAGIYTVLTVPDANHFTIGGPYSALSSSMVAENGGLVQIQEQGTGDPIDRIMTPISRTDWAVIPDKVIQGPPTIYWYNRTIVPNLNIWQPPDGNGPYVLKYYRMRRIQDANLGMGETPDMPFRHLDAFCAGMAARLAQKWAPALEDKRKLQAIESWKEAWHADRERAAIQIRPDFSPYYSDI